MSNALRTLLFAMVILCACENSQDKHYRTKDVTKSLNGIVMASDVIMGYGLVAVYDDYLLMKVNRDTSRLVVYKIKGDTLQYHKGLIDRGRGPKEFYYVEYALKGDTLFVSNSDPGGIRGIYGIPLSDMSIIDDPDVWKEYQFKESDIMTGLSFAPCGDGKFIITGGKANTHQIFSIADFASGATTPIEFWPEDDTKGPLHSMQMVYMQSKLCSSNNRFVYANLNARYMFISFVEDDALIIKSIIYGHIPQYKIMPDENIRFTEDGEYGILPYATSDFVYAKVGRTVREVKAEATYKGYPAMFTDEVEVYDWDGRFIDNFMTDRPFLSFVVSADNRYLFTMTQDLNTEEPVIIRYKLPNSCKP